MLFNDRRKRLTPAGWQTAVDPADVLTTLMRQGGVETTRASLKTAWNYFVPYQVVLTFGTTVRGGFFREEEICMPIKRHKKGESAEDFAHRVTMRLYLRTLTLDNSDTKSCQVAVRKPRTHDKYDEVVLSQFQLNAFEDHVDKWEDDERICYLDDLINAVSIIDVFQAAHDYYDKIRQARQEYRKKNHIGRLNR